MLNEYGQPDYRINYKLRRDRAVNELLGLARGLIADGVVSDAEANELRLWARQNPDLCISFPGNELYHRLDAIYQDGRIDGDERQELLWFLEQFAGDGEPDESEGMGTTSLPLTRPAPKIVHAGAEFVVTGRFVSGVRPAITARIVNLGGSVHPRVTLNTTYLLLGSMCSRDWKHSSFGRKIEKAVELRERGYPIAIVSEEHWAASLH